MAGSDGADASSFAKDTLTTLGANLMEIAWGIFYSNEEEKALAEKSKAEVEAKLGKKIVTPIVSAKEFYPAEDYHQDYYKKNPLHYKFYRYGCGRDARLEAVWGKEEGS